MTVFDKIKEMNIDDMASYFCHHIEECGEDKCPVYNLCTSTPDGFKKWLSKEV